MPGCGHRDIAHAILPKELVKKGGVHSVGTTEVKGLAFFPFLGVHLINEAVVAVAIVGGKRGLLAGAAVMAPLFSGPESLAFIGGTPRSDSIVRTMLMVV